jgi:hypothetical protein
MTSDKLAVAPTSGWSANPARRPGAAGGRRAPRGGNTVKPSRGPRGWAPVRKIPTKPVGVPGYVPPTRTVADRGGGRLAVCMTL